jgi:hypothetical protein
VKQAVRILIMGLLAAAIALAAAVPGGGVVTLGSSPAALCSGPNCQMEHVIVRVIPGYVCKAYVGGAGFDRASYAGVWSVLFPNATGGWSEEFNLEDPRGQDGIDRNVFW